MFADTHTRTHIHTHTHKHTRIHVHTHKRLCLMSASLSVAKCATLLVCMFVRLSPCASHAFASGGAGSLGGRVRLRKTFKVRERRRRRGRHPDALARAGARAPAAPFSSPPPMPGRRARPWTCMNCVTPASAPPAVITTALHGTFITACMISSLLSLTHSFTLSLYSLSLSPPFRSMRNRLLFFFLSLDNRAQA